MCDNDFYNFRFFILLRLNLNWKITWQLQDSESTLQDTSRFFQPLVKKKSHCYSSSELVKETWRTKLNINHTHVLFVFFSCEKLNFRVSNEILIDWLKICEKNFLLSNSQISCYNNRRRIVDFERCNIFDHTFFSKQTCNTSFKIFSPL